MTIDELLQKHPLPWSVWSDTEHIYIRDAKKRSVNTCTDTSRAICDAMQELVRLRDDRLTALKHYAEKTEYVRTIETLRARNAELEAFKERVMDAPKRLCKELWRHGCAKCSDACVDGVFDSAIFGEDGAL